MKTGIVSGLSALMLILFTAGESFADRPDIKVEKGAPGSGIKTTTRVFREQWDKTTQSFVSRESDRTVLFEDGRSENWAFNDDGMTMAYHKLIDANGYVREFTQYGVDGVIEHIIRDRNSRANVYINVDVTKEVKVNVGDQLFFVSLSDPWPGFRQDKVDTNKHSGLKQIATLPQAPASLPSGAKMVDGYDVDAVSKGSVTVETTIITPGGASRNGTRPSSKTTTRKIEVVASAKVAATTSGIEGNAIAEPTQPGGRPGHRAVPLAIIIVKDAATGKEVARTTADAKGKFELPLKPGTYVIEPVDPAAKGAIYPRASKQTVTVTANQWLKVTARFDTGIR